MRNLTPAQIAAILAPESGDVPIFLVTISHANFTTRRICTDNQNVVHGGNTYTPENFVIILPEDDRQNIPTGQLRIQAVDRKYVQDLDNAMPAGMPTVEVRLVFSSAPENLVFPAETFNLSYHEVHDTTGEIICTLSLDLPTDEAFPGINFDRANNPGLWEDF